MDFITQASDPGWLFSWKVQTKTSLTSRCVESLASIPASFLAGNWKQWVMVFVPSGLKSPREESAAETF